MKESKLSFVEGFLGSTAPMGSPLKAFNFDMAANLIKEKLKDHPDLIAEAGLEGDWDYTGGVIFQDGKPVSDDYTYLASNWAIPTLIFSWGEKEQESIDCWVEENKRFNSNSQWDEQSLKLLL